MSLALSPVLDVKGGTAANATPLKLVVGFGSGNVQVYSREDHVLERSFSAGKARVDAIQWIPNTDLVAIVCSSRCNVYNLATRRLETSVNTRSARFIRAHALPEGGRLAVASTYKLRLLDFSPDSSLSSETLLAAPDKHKLGALEAWNRDFYVIFGSKPKLYRVEKNNLGFRPLVLLHPLLGAARRFVLVAAGNVLFIGSNTAAQLLELGQNNEAPRVIAMLDQVNVTAAAPIQAQSTKIPLFSIALSGSTLSLVNPRTGNILTKITSSAEPVVTRNTSLALLDTVYSMDCDLSIDFITRLGDSDLREAATLALSLSPEHTVDNRVRNLQQKYAIQVFEQGDDDDHIAAAMRLFTAIEEQEQSHDPTNHQLVVDRVINPFLDKVTEASDLLETGSTAATQSIFSARTTPRRKHVLDPIVAYLVYARRHLRLAGFQNESTGIDTALFRCYMIMHSPLVAPLLRSPNQCDPNVVKESLLTAGKWRELVWFLRSRNDPDQHRQALDLLVEHRESSQNIISYLEQAHTEPSIVFEYAEPLLKEDPQLAQRLFFEESSYDSWDVYRYLHKIDIEIANEYALYRVNYGNDQRAEIHETVARLLASTELDLIDFLNKSTIYRPSVLVNDSAIPPRARALLHSKMQQHTAAIDLYLDPLQDFDAARKEAEEHLCATYLFDKLLGGDNLELILNKASPDSDLSFAYALQKLPNETSVQSLAPFLKRFTAAKESKEHRLELTEAFSRVALTDYSLQLMDLRKERYVVTSTTACAVCHKRLGQAVMGIRAGAMVHYGCLER